MPFAAAGPVDVSEVVDILSACTLHRERATAAHTILYGRASTLNVYKWYILDCCYINPIRLGTALTFVTKHMCRQLLYRAKFVATYLYVLLLSSLHGWSQLGEAENKAVRADNTDTLHRLLEFW